MKFYVLKGTEVVEATRDEWALFFEDFDARRVTKTFYRASGVQISTVFLGIDYGFIALLF